MAQDKDKPKRGSDDLIDWFTISYRSIYIAVGLVVLLAAGAAYWYYTKYAEKEPPSAIDVAPAQAVPTASFFALEGSVQVKKAGQLQWVPANKDLQLNQGDLVRTGSGAGAEIRFSNGITFHMRADSLITIEEATADASGKRQRVTANIQSGSFNFETGGASTTIQTPVSRTTTGSNSEGDVTVSAQTGETITKLFRGEATTETTGGQTFALKPNTSVIVDPTGKSEGMVSLPGVPTLLAPPHQAEITYVNPAVSTTLLAWKGVPSATTYHVLVDYSTSFTRPLVDQKGWKLNSMELRGLEVGKYFWKVSAVDANGMEGSFSEFSRFSVTKPGPGAAADAPPPSLNLESLEPSSNILHVKGRTEPGASLTVNGQRVDVQTDGTFNEFITLDKPGRQDVVIRATSIAGGVNEQKRPVVVTY